MSSEKLVHDIAEISYIIWLLRQDLELKTLVPKRAFQFLPFL